MPRHPPNRKPRPTVGFVDARNMYRGYSHCPVWFDQNARNALSTTVTIVPGRIYRDFKIVRIKRRKAR